MKTPNNLSADKFQVFLEKFNATRLKGHRQVALLPNGVRVTFSITTRNIQKVECRQMYSDCDGFVCYHIPDGRYYYKNLQNRDELESFPVSRILKNGIKSYNVKIPIQETFELV